MKRSFSIVIVGGGMVGLTLANLLARNRRLDVQLIDAGPRPQAGQKDDVGLRVSAISPGSADILASVGSWQEILSVRACAYTDMKVWDASGHAEGPETLVFSASEFALPQLGFIVENNLICAALLKSLQQTEVSVRFDMSIERMYENDAGYTLDLSSGAKLKPDLLIGADGARSFVRGAAEIPVRAWPHDQKALVTHVRPEKPHQETAWQRFLQDGPIGMLPLADGRVSIVWSTTPEKADAALAMSDEDLGKTLTRVSGDILGSLTVNGPRGAFPLQSQHAKTYIKPGLALVGDAAHAVHPLAGQGVNLGLADALQLADVLSREMAQGEHIGDLPVLRKYERARFATNQVMLSFLDGLNRLFAAEAAPFQSLRSGGMYVFNRSGPIKERMASIALGIR